MPVNTQIHVDQRLTDMSVAQIQAADSFVANQLFPTVPVSKRSDLYTVYNRNELWRSDAGKRAPNSESRVRDYSLSTASYYCDRISIAYDLTEEEMANSDPALDPEGDAMALLTQDLMIEQDVSWAAAFFANNLWGTSLTPSPLWSDAASDPIADHRLAAQTIRLNGGREANKIVYGRLVYDELLDHPDVLDRIKYTQSAVGLSASLLASLFGVDQVLVSNAVQNTAQEGLAAVYARIAGSHGLMVHAAPAPGLRIPSAGYTFRWTGLFGATDGFRGKRIETPEKSTQRIELDHTYDQVIVASELGYFFDTAI